MAEIQPKIEMVSAPRMVGDAAILTVRGDIDLHNSPVLRRTMLEVLGANKAKKLILDLSQVAYMDSSAVAVLVEALQHLRRRGGKMVLAALQPRVRGLLEIARLDTMFVLAANETEALTK